MFEIWICVTPLRYQNLDPNICTVSYYYVRLSISEMCVHQ